MLATVDIVPACQTSKCCYYHDGRLIVCITLSVPSSLLLIQVLLDYSDQTTVDSYDDVEEPKSSSAYAYAYAYA